MELASLGQPQRQLDPGALEVKVQGNQGQSLLLQGDAKFGDLAPVCQELSHPQGLVVEEPTRMAVGRDVHVVQLQLAIADQAEAIPQVALPGPNGFHLRSQQFDARLQGFENLVLVAGQAIVSQQALGGISLGGASPPAGPLGHRASVDSLRLGEP